MIQVETEVGLPSKPKTEVAAMRRGVNEHSAHQQQKQTAEHVVYVENALIGIALDHLGHLGAAVTQQIMPEK